LLKKPFITKYTQATMQYIPKVFRPAPAPISMEADIVIATVAMLYNHGTGDLAKLSIIVRMI